MTVPQPFQYQGSKQALAALILRYSVMGLCIWLFVGCVAPASKTASSSAPAVITVTGAGTNDVAPGLPHKSTPFESYDNAIVASIEKRWYELLDTKQFRQNRTGKVVVRFHLHADGTASDMTILDNNVGALLGLACKNSIQRCAPFAPWPPDMARMVGKDYREITFTFYYSGK